MKKLFWWLIVIVWATGCQYALVVSVQNVTATSRVAGFDAGWEAGCRAVWVDAVTVGAAYWTSPVDTPDSTQRVYGWVRPNQCDLAEASRWRQMLREKAALKEFVRALVDDQTLPLPPAPKEPDGPL
jgi:hypothetical protein